MHEQDNQEKNNLLPFMSKLRTHFEGSRTGEAPKRRWPKQKSLKTQPRDIEYLFIRFSHIYGSAWDKELINDVVGMAEEWLDALQGVSRKELEIAIRKAREDHPTWPPKVGEFLKICKNLVITNPEQRRKIEIAQAAIIANKRIQRLYPYSTQEMHFCATEIYNHLRDKIFSSQNELWDFSMCSTAGCLKFKIFYSAQLEAWQCDDHSTM